MLDGVNRAYPTKLDLGAKDELMGMDLFISTKHDLIDEGNSKPILAEDAKRMLRI